MHPYSPRPCTHRSKFASALIGHLIRRCHLCKQVVPNGPE